MLRNKIIGLILMITIFNGIPLAFGYQLPAQSNAQPDAQSNTQPNESTAQPANKNFLINSTSIVKRAIFEDESLGLIKDIKINNGTNSNSWRIACAGEQGAAYLDKDSKKISLIEFSACVKGVRFLEQPESKELWYYGRGEAWSNSSLINNKGKMLWSYGSDDSDSDDENLNAVDNMCAGDLDGSGQIRFIVGLNGKGGIRMLDKSGKEKWNAPDGNAWHIELINSDKPGIKNILHTDYSGSFTVRDDKGNIVRQFNAIDDNFSSAFFTLCHWPNKSSAEHIMIMQDKKIYIVDLYGKLKAELDAPLADRSGEPRCVNVKLKANEPDYLAIVVNLDVGYKPLLYIFNSAKELVYMEKLPGRSGAITTIPTGNNREDLLISAGATVWQYKADK